MNKIIGVVAGLALLLSIIGLVGGNQSVQTGGTTNYDDLSLSGDLTVNGGSLDVPTASGATSTLVVGEVETYATSSATKVCLKFNTVATSSQAGYVLWNYGTCP